MVFRSGVYAFSPGMTLGDLIQKGKGLKPGYDETAIKLRYVSDTKINCVKHQDYSSRDFKLEEWDTVQIDAVPNYHFSIQRACRTIWNILIYLRT